MNERWFAVACRWFAGCAFCFFAIGPAWIGANVLVQIAQNPRQLFWPMLLVLAVCAALLYFLLLLAYRAFTGRGRKQDGGLLPPWAMKGFVHVWGVMAVCFILIGIYQQELRPIVGGIASLVTAYGALYAHVNKRGPGA